MHKRAAVAERHAKWRANDLLLLCVQRLEQRLLAGDGMMIVAANKNSDPDRRCVIDETQISPPLNFSDAFLDHNMTRFEPGTLYRVVSNQSPAAGASCPVSLAVRRCRTAVPAGSKPGTRCTGSGHQCPPPYTGRGWTAGRSAPDGGRRRPCSAPAARPARCRPRPAREQHA